MQILQQNFHGEGQFGNAFETAFLRVGQAEIGVALATHFQGAAAFETVGMGGHGSAFCLLRLPPDLVKIPAKR